MPLSFPSVEPRVFWNTEMTAMPKSTLGKGKITRSTIYVHSTTTFHNLTFLLLSLILNTTNAVLRFQQHAIHMRNNDSVICLSYRLWNTTKHLSVNIKSCHAVIDIRFNPSRANSSDNYNFVSFPLKSRNGVLVALQNAYYFRQCTKGSQLEFEF